MLSVRAIYDGKHFRLLDSMKVEAPVKVIITFLDDEDIKASELHYLAAKGKAFDFLENKVEDIYSDKDLKVRYKKK